ncbi:xanthine dehydrogenase accessory protein XdhC [Sagittula salina]|uniref:Xanthine dehydrogenase accessory protein XdhC n=1 Tax=Sagittula salina TaxID=2820268 RepID=A0A940MQA6_9RHOB|nr:xanthine dehydrogenase accessory protein XdhC [Sagittula salina]MBP0483855.1 xanthine dehydrogenase accessory protein XdhC [Sagittula salina]
MSLDLDTLRAACVRHGTVARVVVAATAGSTPREVGAAMLVWREGTGFGQSGTIGGGALELEAAQRAFDRNGFTRHPLGPDLGQCCGGAVTLLTERFTADTLPVNDTPFARGPGAMPLEVARLLDHARARGLAPDPKRFGDWMVEPILRPARDLWIWGAGHVGRALVATLAPLPDLRITWVDTAPERFPPEVMQGVTTIPTAAPAHLMAHAPRDAEHLILTYSHAIDFALCNAAITRGFKFCGLIGSDTKWARFSRRLRASGHDDAAISRICCPIGQKDLGKHPQAIAIGVATQLLEMKKRQGQHSWTTRSSA